MRLLPRTASTRRGRFSRNTRRAGGQSAAWEVENSAEGGTDCRPQLISGNSENDHFIGFFGMARGLLIGQGRVLRRLSEFCHAACSWCRVGCLGRHQIADLAKAVVVEGDL